MNYLWRVQAWAQNATTSWQMATKYGYHRDLLTAPLDAYRERLWLCHIRGRHQEKFAARGFCYRCRKDLRG